MINIQYFIVIIIQAAINKENKNKLFSLKVFANKKHIMPEQAWNL